MNFERFMWEEQQSVDVHIFCAGKVSGIEYTARAHADYFLVHEDERWKEKDESLITPSKHCGESFWNHGVVVLIAGASNEITDEEFEKDVNGGLIPSIQRGIKAFCPSLDRDVPVVVVENVVSTGLPISRGGPDCFKKLIDAIEVIVAINPEPFRVKYPCSRCGTLLCKSQLTEDCPASSYHPVCTHPLLLLVLIHAAFHTRHPRDFGCTQTVNHGQISFKGKATL